MMPQILEVPANEVRPFDLLDEGCLVVQITWNTSTRKVIITTCAPRFVQVEMGTPMDPNTYWDLDRAQESTISVHDEDEMVRVARNMPIGPYVLRASPAF